MASSVRNDSDPGSREAVVPGDGGREEGTADDTAAALSVPMYFRLDRKRLRTPEAMKKIIKIGTVCLGQANEKYTEINLGSEYDRLFIFCDTQGSHLVMRLYDDGLLTLDLQCRETDHSIFNTSSVRTLERKLAIHLGSLCVVHNSLYCPIRRGQSVWPYAVSADERLLEFDYDAVVFETNSKWQNIRIFHSKLLGNTLVLDGECMLGESDLIYTQTLCHIGREVYQDKTVLVLGGGDGAILHELLKENPQFITIAEIDFEVIDACRRYLRGVCGDSLDQLSGSNYQIVLDDCTKVLKENVEKGVVFDYVINDLTEFPVNKSVPGFENDCGSANLIMQLSVKVLKPGGKMFARGNCIGATSYRAELEQDIRCLDCCFHRRDLYIPSFQEVYCFYEIWRNSDISHLDSSVDQSK